MKYVLLLVAALLATPAHADEFAVAAETIGPIRHGMTDARVQRAAGAPARKGAPHFAGEATSDWEKDWTYDGATVTFYADTKTGPTWTVRRIEVARGTWKTQRGIRIGATREQVEKAYADVKDKETSNDEQLVAGSIYGGVIFTFKAGKVATIFVGASAF